MKAGHHYDRGSDTSWLLLYSAHPDVFVAAPPSVRDIAQHVAQATYQVRKTAKGISVYSLPFSAMEVCNDTNLVRNVQVDNDFDGTETAKRFGVNASILHNAPEQTLNVILRDVELFAGTNPQNASHPNGTKYVDSLQPNTTTENYGDVKIEGFGKQDGLDLCILDLNADFLFATCATRSTAEGYFDPWGGCNYCYAQGRHNRAPTKSVRRVDKDSLVAQIVNAKVDRAMEDKPTRYLRFGKLSEPGSELTEEAFIATLNACIETEMKPIIPTKFLAYDPAIANKLIIANAALLYSIGSDQLEPGAAAMGKDNDFRFRQAIEYK